MNKKTESLVKSVVELHEDMNALTVDKINNTAPAPQEIEPQTKLSMREIAKMENIPYCEPVRKLGAFGTLPEKQKRDHERDWEYVKGIFENEVCRGEPIRFWFSKYAGDPDCMWEIPANRPVYVPRMIALHLETVMQYHTFDYIEKPSNIWRKDDFTHQFSTTGTFWRGKFRPIGAFAA